MFSHCFLEFSVGVRASVIGLSQISSFSFKNEKFNKNAKVKKITKKVGRGVRLIAKGPYLSQTLS